MILEAMKKMSRPDASVEWNKLPTNADIRMSGNTYIHYENGRAVAVVFWCSRTAYQAQLWLDAMVMHGKKR